MNQRTKSALVGASVVALLVARCGGVLVPPEVQQDASTDSSDDNDIAYGDAFADVIEDTSFLPPPDAGAYPPPSKQCNLDAASKPCPNPPSSVCANSDWLIYYDNGRCIDGGCTWDTHWSECRLHDCKQGYCANFATPN